VNLLPANLCVRNFDAFYLFRLVFCLTKSPFGMNVDENAIVLLQGLAPYVDSQDTHIHPHTHTHTLYSLSPSSPAPVTSSPPCAPPSFHNPLPFVSARTGAYYKVTYLQTLWGKLEYDASKTVATIEEEFRQIAESIAFQDQVRNIYLSIYSCTLPFHPQD